MFHLTDNLFFGRCPDGSVRVLKLPTAPKGYPATSDEYPDAIFDVVIDPSGWASIIATVSAGGEEDLRFFAAKDFHASKGQIAVVPKG